MMKAMLLLLATLAVAHASGVAVLPAVAPVAYDYGTTILDGSFQQSRVTGFTGLGYGLGYPGLLGYKGFGPLGYFGGYYGGLGYGRYLPAYGLGGYYL